MAIHYSNPQKSEQFYGNHILRILNIMCLNSWIITTNMDKSFSLAHVAKDDIGYSNKLTEYEAHVHQPVTFGYVSDHLLPWLTLRRYVMCI